jgi:hypothetical protein
MDPVSTAWMQAVSRIQSQTTVDPQQAQPSATVVVGQTQQSAPPQAPPPPPVAVAGQTQQNPPPQQTQTNGTGAVVNLVV